MTPASKERWLPVVGYEGIYSVSSLGRIRRDVGADRGICYAGRILKTRLSPQGYPLVTICKNGVMTAYSVHCLVAYAFLGPRPSGFEVDHINGIKSDPSATNLEYVTQLENHRRSHQLGLKASGDRHGARLHPETRPRGEQSGKSVYKESQVRAIKQDYADGLGSYRTLAIKHNVPKSFVAAIIGGKTWRHVIVTSSHKRKGSGTKLL